MPGGPPDHNRGLGHILRIRVFLALSQIFAIGSILTHGSTFGSEGVFHNYDLADVHSNTPKTGPESMCAGSGVS